MRTFSLGGVTNVPHSFFFYHCRRLPPSEAEMRLSARWNTICLSRGDLCAAMRTRMRFFRRLVATFMSATPKQSTPGSRPTAAAVGSFDSPSLKTSMFQTAGSGVDSKASSTPRSAENGQFSTALALENCMSPIRVPRRWRLLDFRCQQYSWGLQERTSGAAQQSRSRRSLSL